jgi:segregation and condensation protein A
MTREELFAFDPISGEESSSYSVQLDKFEGPLDLLLYLIRKDEIDIYDIPIAKITGQYLEYIELMRMLDLDVAGEFIMMAATLIRIKAKLLLPRREDDDEDDPREELILALLEYKKYKEASGILHCRESKERDILKRSDFSIVEAGTVEDFVLDATVFDLLAAFKRVMESANRTEHHDVVAEDVKLDDCIETVLIALQAEDGVEFERLFPSVPYRMLVIVTFIAVLELVKRNRIWARQSSPLGQIRLYRREVVDEGTV